MIRKLYEVMPGLDALATYGRAHSLNCTRGWQFRVSPLYARNLECLREVMTYARSALPEKCTPTNAFSAAGYK